MLTPDRPTNPIRSSRAGGGSAGLLLLIAAVLGLGLAILGGAFDPWLRGTNGPAIPAAAPLDEQSTAVQERAVGDALPEQNPGAASPAQDHEPELVALQKNNLAVELLEKGELDSAIKLFQDAVETVPGNQTYRNNLRNALLRRAGELTKEDPAAAALDYDQALELAENDEQRDRIRELAERSRAIAREEENFVVESTLHFTFRFDGERDEIIGGVDELKVILEAAYQEYGDLFRRRPVEEGEPRIEVVLYRSEGFNAVTGLGDWAGGVFDGTIRVPADDLRERSRVARLKSVLRHEVAHAFTASIGGKHVPAWLNEGLAQWLETPRTSTSKVDLARERLAASSSPLFQLSELQGTLALWQDRAKIARAYDQALAFTSYLIATYGSDLVFDMVAACKSGGAGGAATRFQSALLIGLDTVLDDFRDGLSGR